MDPASVVLPQQIYKTVYQYCIRFDKGSETDKITEHSDFSLRELYFFWETWTRLSDALCESPPRAPEGIGKRTEEVGMCHRAKGKVFAAQTQDETEQAAREKANTLPVLIKQPRLS